VYGKGDFKNFETKGTNQNRQLDPYCMQYLTHVLMSRTSRPRRVPSKSRRSIRTRQQSFCVLHGRVEKILPWSGWIWTRDAREDDECNFSLLTTYRKETWCLCSILCTRVLVFRLGRCRWVWFTMVVFLVCGDPQLLSIFVSYGWLRYSTARSSKYWFYITPGKSRAGGLLAGLALNACVVYSLWL
jgi:hypothetical protein